MLDKSKENVEAVLLETLKEGLESMNQESGVLSVEFDRETMTCTAKLNVVLIEEQGEEFIGFEGY